MIYCLRDAPSEILPEASSYFISVLCVILSICVMFSDTTVAEALLISQLVPHREYNLTFLSFARCSTVSSAVAINSQISMV
jgi:hypothetical protein